TTDPTASGAQVEAARVEEFTSEAQPDATGAEPNEPGEPIAAVAEPDAEAELDAVPAPSEPLEAEAEPETEPPPAEPAEAPDAPPGAESSVAAPAEPAPEPLPAPARTVGLFVADALRAVGVRYAFTVPGESFLGLLEGLDAAGIRVVATRHEGAAAFMAEAHG